jgi:hypothetical protein
MRDDLWLPGPMTSGRLQPERFTASHRLVQNTDRMVKTLDRILDG